MPKHPIQCATPTTIATAAAMVTGFITAELHERLRHMATDQGRSESALVSDFVIKALKAPARKRRLKEPM